MREFIGAVGLQARLLSRKPDDLMLLFTTPLVTVVFISIFTHAHRGDLGPYAVVAPAMMAVFQMSLFVSGELIGAERQNGLFEATLTTPAQYSAVLFGRTLTVTVVSFLSLAESIIVGAILGVVVHVYHPLVFAGTLVTTAFAMTGTAGAMAALFVVSRNTRTFQNALSYPFFVLGGVIVPITFLPVFIQPLSWIVFLSWSSDLLRDSLAAPEVASVWWRLGAVVGLGLIALVVGESLLRWTLKRTRVDGTMGLA